MTWKMTSFKCVVCGHTSLMKTNFKFSCNHDAYCIKNKHADKVIKINTQLDKENENRII